MKPVIHPVLLLVLSDLHIEFGPFESPDPALYELVVLAGDTGVGERCVQWAREQPCRSGEPIVMVPGNHEFYRVERSCTLRALREAARGSNEHLLDRDEIILRGVRFLGATLWTDFALDEARCFPTSLAMRHARRGLNDFAGAIRQRMRQLPGERPFSPEDAAGQHRLVRAWLQQRLDVQHEADHPVASTVVVTHHGPSGRSIDPRYQRSPLNPCFFSDLPESFFGQAALWVHGHTHSSTDYRHHGTRVIANPRGYVRLGRPENRDFKGDCVATLPGAAHD